MEKKFDDSIKQQFMDSACEAFAKNDFGGDEQKTLGMLAEFLLAADAEWLQHFNIGFDFDSYEEEGKTVFTDPVVRFVPQKYSSFDSIEIGNDYYESGDVFMEIPCFDDLDDETDQMKERQMIALEFVEAVHKENIRKEILRKAVMPGKGFDPLQQTFILMWNPAISSTTIHNHIDSIPNIDDWEFNWSVYEWEKAKLGDRFFMVRVGGGNTGIVMSGIFTSEPYSDRDWNRVRKNKEIHYMDMKPNFIVNPETMPIITTAQLQEAIPDFDWSKGHSGTLLTDAQARKLEEVFAGYLHTVEDKMDGEDLNIKHLIDAHDTDCINAVLQVNADKFFQIIEEKPLASYLMTDTQLVSRVKFPLHYVTICWDAILSRYDEYAEEYKETVYRKKLQNDRIKEYFIMNYAFNMDTLRYGDYRNCFFCADPEDTIEDFMWKSESDLLEKGYLQKDIDLYCSVRKMDFETTKLLLEEGANPNTFFAEEYAEDEDCENCWDIVCGERSFLSERLDYKIFDNDATPFNTDDVENLIGYAAYETMYNMLKPYIKGNRS